MGTRDCEPGWNKANELFANFGQISVKPVGMCTQHATQLFHHYQKMTAAYNSLTI